MVKDLGEKKGTQSQRQVVLVLPNLSSLGLPLGSFSTYTIFSKGWLGVFLFFYILFIFNWKIITLQYCVGLYHTLTGAGHRYTYVPSLFNLPPTSHPIKGWLGF